MTTEAQPHPADPFFSGRCGAAFNGFSGPPLVFKLVGLGVAFLIARPLGLALLAFMLFKAARRHWGWGHRFGAGPDFGWRRQSGNSAMDEKRRATLEALAEEEKAFTEFERRQREAKEREEFERFVAERNAPKGDA
jgi:Protein of unknown function (DUF2852)